MVPYLSEYPPARPPAHCEEEPMKTMAEYNFQVCQKLSLLTHCAICHYAGPCLDLRHFEPIFHGCIGVPYLPARPPTRALLRARACAHMRVCAPLRARALSPLTPPPPPSAPPPFMCHAVPGLPGDRGILGQPPAQCVPPPHSAHAARLLPPLLPVPLLAGSPHAGVQ